MEYVFWWLVLATPCFFVVYCYGAHMNSRLDLANHNSKIWRFRMSLFRDGFQLLVHDYFGVHCPWSWERAKKHRLADMRMYLGTDGRCHDHLGHITAADCDNPEKQEAIARYAYISRTKHWTSGLLRFPIAPILIIFIVIITTLEDFRDDYCAL